MANHSSTDKLYCPLIKEKCWKQTTVRTGVFGLSVRVTGDCNNCHPGQNEYDRVRDNLPIERKPGMTYAAERDNRDKGPLRAKVYEVSRKGLSRSRTVIGNIVVQDGYASYNLNQ